MSTVPMPARLLCGDHLGKKVEITSREGATINDTLVCVVTMLDDPDRPHNVMVEASTATVLIYVNFENVRGPGPYGGLEATMGAFALDPDSIVNVKTTEDVPW